MTIGKKMLLGGAGLVLFATITVAGISLLLMERNLADLSSRLLGSASATNKAYLHNLSANMDIFASIYSVDQEILGAVASQDHAGLEKAMTTRYGELSKRIPAVATLEITDAQGVVVMRGHNPKVKGDDKSKVPMIQTALGGTQTVDLTVSITTKIMAMDAVYPLRRDGKVVGTVKVGSYLNQNTAVRAVGQSLIWN